jgi:acylphosphatase
VQGVCFRITTSELARGFEVSGHVRNLPDGTVELEAQGESAEVDRFLASVQSRFERNIVRSDVGFRPLKLGESGFVIIH